MNPKKTIRINKGAIDMLKAYDWPGNFREFRNVIHRTLLRIRLEDRHVIRKFDLEELGWHINNQNKAPNIFEGSSWKDIHVIYADYLLNKHGGNKTKAAEAAKMSRQFIYSAIDLKEQGFGKKTT